mmetsp:Transcript_13788/g.21822  ORF Transcript_13788/g.21822 Transcript_13788/m.21822 type:complete len:193 (+) Transcript_13788:305-883(+)
MALMESQVGEWLIQECLPTLWILLPITHTLNPVLSIDVIMIFCLTRPHATLHPTALPSELPQIDRKTHQYPQTWLPLLHNANSQGKRGTNSRMSNLFVCMISRMSRRSIASLTTKPMNVHTRSRINLGDLTVSRATAHIMHLTIVLMETECLQQLTQPPTTMETPSSITYSTKSNDRSNTGSPGRAARRMRE